MINFYFGCFFIVIGALGCFFGIREELSSKELVQKSKIIAAFKDVDWSRHHLLVVGRCWRLLTVRDSSIRLRTLTRR